MFRTETLRTDLAFASNQQGQTSSSSGDFAGIQSGIRANLGGTATASSTSDDIATGLQLPLRANLGAGVLWGQVMGSAGDNPTLEYDLLKLFWVKS